MLRDAQGCSGMLGETGASSGASWICPVIFEVRCRGILQRFSKVVPGCSRMLRDSPLNRARFLKMLSKRFGILLGFFWDSFGILLGFFWDSWWHLLPRGSRKPQDAQDARDASDA